MAAPSTGILFYEGRAKPLSTIGLIQPGSYYLFFKTGTLTPTNVYADGNLTTPLSQTPGNSAGTTASSDGRMVPIYLDPAVTYRYQLYNVFNVLLEDVDPFVPATTPSATQIGQALYPQTQTEINAGVTPINYIYPPGNVFRYYTTAQIAQTQAFTSTPTLDCSLAINNAVKSTTGDVFFPTGIHYINAPIYIPTTANQNVRFVGESRTNTKIEPMANNIADGLGINAMIINQASNEKFSMWRIRCTTGDAPSLQTAWAGFSLHAVQMQPWSSSITYTAGALVSNGGLFYVATQASLNQSPPNASFWLQCGTNSFGYTANHCDFIFSGSIEDCWFDAGGIQPFFVGGLNNYHVVNNTFEFQKGCFSITGGTADAHFITNSLSNCFDYFIQATQAPNANIISVRGLHAYTHNRGLLFAFQNAWSILIDDVILQASTGGANLGGIGIGTFIVCNDMTLSNFNVLTSASLGTGATATQITLQACTGQILDGIIDGSDIGILLTGTAANRLTIDSVDIVNTLTAAFRVQTGAPSGTVDIANCNWSNGGTDLILFSNASGALDMNITDCRFVNAGLTAGSGARNLILSSTGNIRISDCVIGQNSGSALANFFIDASGSPNQVYTSDITFLGTAPGGTANQPQTFITGSQTVILDGITGQWTPTVGGSATYTLQQGWYTVNGHSVIFGGRLTINAIGTGSQTTVTGLPFTSSATQQGTGTVPFFSGLATSITTLGLTVAPSNAGFTLRSLAAAGTSTANNNVLTSATDIIFGGSYPLN